MSPQDELRDLWYSQPSVEARKGEDMLALVMERTRKLDRTIASRNTREVIAGLIVAVAFSFIAYRSQSGLEKLGMGLVAASGLWIAFYVWRFGTGPLQPDLGADLHSYERLLIENYDHQIRLLRSVKYWYLLPPYAGFVVAFVGGALRISAERALQWHDFISLTVVTLFFLAVWAANEIMGVKYLQRLKQEIAARNSV